MACRKRKSANATQERVMDSTAMHNLEQLIFRPLQLHVCNVSNHIPFYFMSNPKIMVMVNSILGTTRRLHREMSQKIVIPRHRRTREQQDSDTGETTTDCPLMCVFMISLFYSCATAKT